MDKRLKRLKTLNLEWISYDARLSARRYWAVNTLFDTMITEVLDERKKIWARLDELSAKYGETKDTKHTPIIISSQ